MLPWSPVTVKSTYSNTTARNMKLRKLPWKRSWSLYAYEVSQQRLFNAGLLVKFFTLLPPVSSTLCNLTISLPLHTLFCEYDWLAVTFRSFKRLGWIVGHWSINLITLYHNNDLFCSGFQQTHACIAGFLWVRPGCWFYLWLHAEKTFTTRWEIMLTLNFDWAVISGKRKFHWPLVSSMCIRRKQNNDVPL